MDAPDIEPLARHALFADVDPEAVHRLERASRRITLQPGDELVALGETTGEVYIRLSGSLRVMVYTAYGKAVRLRIPSDAAIHGALSLFDGRPAAASVEAATAAMVAAVRGPAFLAALDEHPELRRRVIAAIGAEARAMIDQVVELAALGVRARLHAELRRLKGGAERAPTHADLASRVGTNRETVSREIGRLRRAGVLRRVDGALVLADAADGPDVGSR